MSKAATLTVMLSLAATLAFAQTQQQSSSAQDDQDQVQTQPSPEPRPAEPQSREAPLSRRPEPSTNGRDIPLGTEIRATLDTPLSTRISRPGDHFTATVQQPVRANNGEVVVPAESKIEGEVTQVEQGKFVPALRGKGHLDLRFRDVRLANGETIPLTATLVSVHATRGVAKTNEEGQVSGGTSGKDTAKDVGIGSGLGALAGLIFGSPLKGLVIGAAAGGGYVLGTKGKDVELPSQTGLVLHVDRDIPVPAPPAGT